MNKAALAYLAKRLERLERIRVLLDRELELATQEYCIRRKEIAEIIAVKLKLPASGRLQHDVTLVARSMGFVPVKPMGRRLYSHCRYRHLEPAVALADSRLLRKDPRNGP